MNHEEYLIARDSLFSDYDREVIFKYDLDHIMDKVIYQHSELIEKNSVLEKKLDEVYQDLNNASIAQTNLLPKKINFTKELDFTARFIPSQVVSGDTYNVFRLDEQHVGLYQIDISGHGVAAALFSVSLSQMLNANIANKNLLKAKLTEPPWYKINSPAEVIRLLSEENFFERYDIYFTMVYMIINTKTGKVTFSRAGHNPPIILRTNGTVEQPEQGTIPVGWDFARQDINVSLQLNPGDRVFLFSDGICETRNGQNEWFGNDRLSRVIEENIHNSVDETLNDTIRSLTSFSGNVNFDDDISIIGLTYLGSKNE
jgi:sigma-B regulation protein RsbU (phosphoserine phosphatase)